MTNPVPIDPAEARRLQRDERAEPVEEPIPTTSDGYATSLDVYGRDVVDTGLMSDAGVNGAGVDLDALPGDETPITPAARREP